MDLVRFLVSSIALPCAFCGCSDRNLAQGELLQSVRQVVIQFREDGGRKLNTIHACGEIEREIMDITNMEIRIQSICNASDALMSMDFSRLSYADKAEAAYKYWHLTSRFYSLMSESGISDRQRMLYLVGCLKKYKDVSFSVPMTARMQGESDVNFATRKAAIRQLYSEYVNNVRLWERAFRSGALRTMRSIDERSLAKATSFLLEYPSKSDLLQAPVFAEPTHASRGMTIKSPVFPGRHPSEFPEDGDVSKFPRKGE